MNIQNAREELALYQEYAQLVDLINSSKETPEQRRRFNKLSYNGYNSQHYKELLEVALARIDLLEATLREIIETQQLFDKYDEDWLAEEMKIIAEQALADDV